MKFYEPRTDLYKNVYVNPKRLKVYIVVRVPAGEVLVKTPADDPEICDRVVYLRYKRDSDAAKTTEYYALFSEEFDWTGESINVETYIEGEGKSVNSSDKADPLS